MDVIWNRYYSLVEKLALFTGMWPYLKPRTRYLRIALMTVNAVTLFVLQVAYQIRCDGNIQCILMSVSTFSFTVIGVVSLYTFPINISMIKHLTECLFADWKKLETLEEIEIFMSHAMFCKRFFMIYSTYCFLGVYGFVSASLIPPILDILLPLNESRPMLLPLSAYYFVDPRKYLIYIYGYVIVSCTILMTAIVAHDCIFVTYVDHVCRMFAVLGSRFECLFSNCDNAEKNTKPDSDVAYCKRIAYFVDIHRQMLEFVKLVENTFTLPFAMHLLIIIVSISCTLLQITQREAGGLEMSRYIFYVMGQLFHLFCLSFAGQKLIDHSLRICDKIYNSSWYEAPIKSQKLLILTIIRSLRPTFLSAGKVYIFSLESFTTVVQTSMSYFTVLASFQ